MWTFILMIINVMGFFVAFGMNKRIRLQLIVFYWVIALNMFYLLHNILFVYVNIKSLLEDWTSLVALLVFTYLSWRKESKLLYYTEIKGKC